MTTARLARWSLGLVLGFLARAWLGTLRVEVEADPGLATTLDRAWVLAFFHGTQWPLLAWRRRRATLVMVSKSLDGTMQGRALSTLGFRVIRGSSSRGGLRALAAIVHTMRGGEHDAAFAVDGPRGPHGVVKGGARLAARATGGVLVPMGSAFARGFVLARTWDRFGVAWPWSRVVITLGAPIDPGPSADADDGRLGRAIVAANERAGLRLGARAPSAASGAASATK